MGAKIAVSICRRRLFLAAALGCVSAAGCGVKNSPADPEVAKRSLEAALASWKQGEAPAALAQRTPPITVGDFAWNEGRKLTDYRFVGEPTNDGYNLHYSVELTLAGERGASVELATYTVGASPAITIFRE